MKILRNAGLAALVLGVGCSRVAAPVVPTGDAADAVAGVRIVDATVPKATITEYPIPLSNSGAIHIVSAPGKAQELWFTEYDGNALGEITTAGKITEHSLAGHDAPKPHALSLRQPFVSLPPSGNAPYGIVVAADHELWFSDERKTTNYAVRVSTSGYTAYAAAQVCCIQNLANGPDKTLWFPISNTQESGSPSAISSITATGKVTAHNLKAGSNPGGIVEGPDRAMWFTEYSAGKIGRVTAAGAIKEYSLPDSSEPLDITVGPDGALWFTEYGIDSIGRITVSGSVKQYKLPSGSAPGGITVGPDRALWFTESGAASIGRLTTAGSLHSYATPTSSSEPYFITVGPDHALWFTEYGANNIGRLAIGK